MSQITMMVKTEGRFERLRTVACSVFLLTLFGLSFPLAPTQGQPEGHWSEPVLLWSERGALPECFVVCPSVPSASFNERGVAVAVWTAGGPGSPHFDTLHAKRFTPAAGWQPFFEVHHEAGRFGMNPQVDLNSNGQGVAVWEISRGNRWDGSLTMDLHARQLAVSSLGGVAHQHNMLASWLSDNRSWAARNPQVQVDALGNALVVWSQWDPSQERDRVYAARLNAGDGWESPTAIDSGIGVAVEPRLAMDDTGVAAVAWLELNGTVEEDPEDPFNPNPVYRGTFDVYVRRFVPGEGWTEVTWLGPLGEDGPIPFQKIVINVAGEVAVSWRSHLSLFSPSSGWRKTPAIPSVQRIQDLAIDPFGVVSAVWSERTEGGYEVYAARTVRLGDSVSWLTTRLGTGSAPQIEADARGNAIAVWLQREFGALAPRTDENYSVAASRYSPDTGWATVITAATELDKYPAAQMLSVNSGGDALIVASTVAYLEGPGAPVMNAESRVWASVSPDPYPPTLTVSEPADGETTTSPLLRVSGITEPGVSLTVNGMVSEVRPDGTFAVNVALSEGRNVIVVTARDWSANVATATAVVTYINPATLEQRLEDTTDALEEALRSIESLRLHVLLLTLSLVAAVALLVLSVLYPRLPGLGGSDLGPGGVKPRDLRNEGSRGPPPPQGGNTGLRTSPTSESTSITEPTFQLTSKERVLLHLLRYSDHRDKREVPRETTQAGISEAARFDQRHFAQYVRPLLRDGLITERSARAEGATQRQKVYSLTHEGRQVANQITNRVKAMMVKVWDGEEIWEVRVSELLRKLGEKASVLDLGPHINQEEIVDLNGLLGDEDLDRGRHDK